MLIDIIFDRLYEYFNVLSDLELSQKMSVSQPAVSKWRSRTAVTAIKKQCRELGIYNEIFGDLAGDSFHVGNGIGKVIGAGAVGVANGMHSSSQNDLVKKFASLYLFAQSRGYQDIFVTEYTKFEKEIVSKLME